MPPAPPSARVSSTPTRWPSTGWMSAAAWPPWRSAWGGPRPPPAPARAPFSPRAASAAGRPPPPGPERARTVPPAPPRLFELSLLQWSFQDFEFRHTRRFPGTVRRVDGRLHNDTGQAFRDALYVNKEKVYFLGADRSEERRVGKEGRSRW